MMSNTLPYTILAIVSVALGSDPDGWVPLYGTPLATTSVADFWTRQWHLTYRRTFGRLAHLPWLFTSKYFSRSTARAVRLAVIFALSAGMHLALMIRMPTDEQHPHRVLDKTTLACFLLQPIGIAFETLVITPLTQRLPPPIRNGLRRVWLWVFMVWTGSYWCDVWVRRGMCDRETGWHSVSLIRSLNLGPLNQYTKW